MRHYQKLRLLAIILGGGLLIYSCQNEEDFLNQQNNKVAETDNLQGAKKLENPYSVKNMKIAFENIKEKLKSKQIAAKSSSSISNLEIKASHYYIKFKPENKEQEGFIKKDSTMYVFDYPLDYEFTDEYLDNRPKLDEGKFPEYYTAIPIDKTLPYGVPYEVIEELYIPEEDPLFNNDSETKSKGYAKKGAINNNEEFLIHLLNEAYTLTGNEDDLLEENQTNNSEQRQKSSKSACCWFFGSKWYPSGTLKIWDDNAGESTTTRSVFSHWTYYDCNDDYLHDRHTERSHLIDRRCKRPIYRDVTTKVKGKYVPLAGAQVLMRQWFTVRQGITNQNGYFRTGSLRGRARYVIQWERYYYSIRNGHLFQAETRGPKKRGDWNHNIKGSDDEYHGMIHTAAHIYYYGSRFGLTSPPKNTNVLHYGQIKIAARERSDASSYSHARNEFTLGIIAQIYINAWGNESDRVFGTTIHELAHAAHSVVDRGSYDNLVRDGWVIPWESNAVRNNNRRTLETWASTVEIMFAVNRYRDFFNQPDYEYRKVANSPPNSGNRQKQTIAYDNHYTSAGWDMIDDFNQREHFGSAYPIDRVSGYTIKQLEDALRGARYWTQWKNNIKSKYNNPTERYLDELFNNWSD